jgi:hypothetical protein
MGTAAAEIAIENLRFFVGNGRHNLDDNLIADAQI